MSGLTRRAVHYWCGDVQAPQVSSPYRIPPCNLPAGIVRKPNLFSDPKHPRPCPDRLIGHLQTSEALVNPAQQVVIWLHRQTVRQAARSARLTLLACRRDILWRLQTTSMAPFLISPPYCSGCKGCT